MTQRWLVIEPFYTGSHKMMLDNLLKHIQPDRYTLLTISGKKWHWRARCSALNILRLLPTNIDSYTTLFCSCVLPLAELIGMSPNLSRLKKIIYFHENQLIYPKQIIKDRDFQYGYNQITSCIAADIVLFNSQFNMDSFLTKINSFLKMIPNYKTDNLPEKISRKSQVFYFPMDYSRIDEINLNISLKKKTEMPKRLCIAWPHRWEFDKNPKLFFDVLFDLKKHYIDFEVVVLGESYNEVPNEFVEAKINLEGNIKHFGYAESLDLYYELLANSHIIVSTADHEFFGVSMLEGVRLGCYPLVPEKLVYPEIYPKSCCYNSQKELFNLLKEFCTNIESFLQLKNEFHMDTEQFDVVNLLPKFLKIVG